MADVTHRVVLEIAAKDKASGVLSGIGGAIGGVGKIALGILGAQAIKKLASSFLNLGKEVIDAGSNFSRLDRTARRTAMNMGVSEKEFDKMIKSLEDTNTFGSNATTAVETFIRSGLVPMAEQLKRVNEKTGETVVGMDAFVLTAKDLGAAAGVSSGEAINLLSDSIARLNPALLDQLKINVSLRQVYRDYAENMGIAIAEMTELDRKQALLNQVMVEGTKVTGAYEEAYGTSAKNVLSLEDATTSLKEQLGSQLEPVLFAVTSKTLAFVKSMRDFVMSPGFKKSFEKIISIIATFLTTFGEAFTEFWREVVDVYNKDLKPALKELGEVVQEVFIELFGESAATSEGFKEIIKDFAVSGAKQLINAIKVMVQVLSVLVKVLSWLIDKITKLSRASTNFTLRAIARWNQFKSTVTGAINAVISTINTLINTLNKIPAVNIPVIGGGDGKQFGGMASGITMVGEAGPELVSLPQGSRVFSNQQSQMMDSGGVTVNFNGNMVVDSDERVNMLVKQIELTLGNRTNLDLRGV